MNMKGIFLGNVITRKALGKFKWVTQFENLNARETHKIFSARHYASNLRIHTFSNYTKRLPPTMCEHADYVHANEYIKEFGFFHKSTERKNLISPSCT